MRNLRHWFLTAGILVLCSQAQMVFANQEEHSAGVNVGAPSISSHSSGTTSRVGIVKTKKCLEDSKLGKQEQANFEKMKQQMASVLQEKERALEEIEVKLNDDDYMDSISDEAASNLKQKKRALRNEGMQLQNQYMQTLEQANMKIIQQLTEAIRKASALVAQDSTMDAPIDVILTDEACTYFAPKLDLTDRIVAKMNFLFETEQKDAASKAR